MDELAREFAESHDPEIRERDLRNLPASLKNWIGLAPPPQSAKNLIVAKAQVCQEEIIKWIARALLTHPRSFSGLEKFGLVGAWSKKISPTAA